MSVKFTLRKAVVALVLAFLVTACGTQGPVNAPRSFGGQTGYSGVAVELLASAQTQTESVTVGRGTLETDGSFTFELDTDLSLDILVAQPALCPDLEERLVVVSKLNVLRDSELIGDIVQASSAEHGRGNGDGAQTVRVYAERSVDAAGSCGSVAYELELTRGWNLVTLETRGESLSYTSGSGPVDWFFIGANTL